MAKMKSQQNLVCSMFPACVSQYVPFSRRTPINTSPSLPSLDPVSPPKPSPFITGILKDLSPEDLGQLEGKLCELETKMIEALPEVTRENAYGQLVPVFPGEILEHLEQNNKRYRSIKSLLAEIALMLS
jgi:hypothetical protein